MNQTYQHTRTGAARAAVATCDEGRARRHPALNHPAAHSGAADAAYQASSPVIPTQAQASGLARKHRSIRQAHSVRASRSNPPHVLPDPALATHVAVLPSAIQLRFVPEVEEEGEEGVKEGVKEEVDKLLVDGVELIDVMEVIGWVVELDADVELEQQYGIQINMVYKVTVVITLTEW
ncbi:hypothetical protein JB92DRAFT_3140152 [Gautieria morchelliformis]|nr:hypothetical protein JB92DRAFT_3140152 [Gautieria morchelliformis]